MRPRNPLATLAASPTMVGAVTVLIAIVTVFMAYNANNSLPFVPVYKTSVDIPNAARLGTNNEVRIGGTRVGVVESIEPIELNAQTAQAGLTPEQSTIGARLNLKLDKTVQPLPQDSVFRVRYRSSFGLKYLEIIRGTGPDADEGFVFDGLNDAEADPNFVGCDIPTDPETFAETIPEQAKDGCFQPQTEFDAIANTFDTKTRTVARENLIEFGNAFAGRGASLNDAIEGLAPLMRNLGPVSRLLADPDTGLRRFFAELADTARIVAPVSAQQAQLFANGAIAFAAFTADTEALQETISEGPETLRTVIDTLPRQRPFLADFAELSRRLRPGVNALQLALPSLNSAIRVGTPVLTRLPAMNNELRLVLVELRRLVNQPSSKLALQRLRTTFAEARPLLEFVTPSQTVCNYFNYWFTFLPSGFDRTQVGYSFRQALTSAPPGPIGLANPLDPDNPIQIPGEVETPIAGYSGNPANGIAGPLPDPSKDGEFQPETLPILHVPINTPAGQKGDADCEQGQIGYLLGDGASVNAPGQPRDNPAVFINDLPGSRGPTTLFYTDDGRRVFRDTRVEARQP